MTKQEYIEQCGVPELAQIDDSVFENIMRRFEATNNREQLRMLECVFLELKSHSKYSEIALNVSRAFATKVEDYRVRPVAKVGDMKEWHTWKFDDLPEYYTSESEIPMKTLSYDRIGNYAYTLGEMCIYRAEHQIDTIYDSIDLEIDNEVTNCISKYEEIRRVFARNGEDFLPDKMGIVEDVKALVKDIEEQNWEYYRQLPKLTGMSSEEVDKRYSKLMQRQPRLANHIVRSSESNVKSTIKNDLDEDRVATISQPQTTQSEEQKEVEEDDKNLLKKALAEMEQHPEKKPKTSIYDPEDFAVEPEEDDRELLKRALAELQEKEQSSEENFLGAMRKQVVTDDKEYEANISNIHSNQIAQEEKEY